MGLNFIDIASWQSGIDLAAVFEKNQGQRPLHGVIVKATQGMKYVNPRCDQWVQWLIANGKLWGFYHYLDHTDAVSEAKRFVQDTINYFGHGVPAADFEGNIVNTYGTIYLRRFVETVYEETGVKPLIYCNLGTIQRDPNGFRTLAEDGYPLWLAQYANMNTQIGFVEHPWQRGSYAPFEHITMHQYSSMGKLNGYDGVLDFDKFYGTAEDWKAMAMPSKPEPEPEPKPDPEPSPEDDWLLDWIEYEQAEADRHLAKVAELKARRAKK